jgi:hypothetical protein
MQRRDFPASSIWCRAGSKTISTSDRRIGAAAVSVAAGPDRPGALHADQRIAIDSITAAKQTTAKTVIAAAASNNGPGISLNHSNAAHSAPITAVPPNAAQAIWPAV